MKNLPEIIDLHKKWLEGDPAGKRADLQRTNLRRADLREANLQGANLRRANLQGANLRGARLQGADLQGAHLQGADLQGAHLHGANLHGVNLRGANLQGANLRGARLQGANLQGADLTDTCLDPANSPSGAGPEFERLPDGRVLGYRTAVSTCCGGSSRYTPGQTYIAPVFSTDGTECHPGLYFFPDRGAADAWARNCETPDVIQVAADPADVHRAGEKWRCRKFEVLGEYKLK